MAASALTHAGCLTIPPGVGALPRFRRWACSDRFPEGVKISFLDGELWIDMSPEDLYAHNILKGEFVRTLGTLLKETRSGIFFSDGALVSNAKANLSTEPDGTYVSWDAFESGAVKEVSGKESVLELSGAPEMVLEVVSPSSVAKDTRVLFELYWRAGISEYWIADARAERLRFEIHRRSSRGYARSRGVAGWIKSTVFGRSFRLTRQSSRRGRPDYTLHVR